MNKKSLPKSKSNIHAKELDWTRQLFSKNFSPQDKKDEVPEHKVISGEENWLDAFMAIGFGIQV